MRSSSGRMLSISTPGAFFVIACRTDADGLPRIASRPDLERVRAITALRNREIGRWHRRLPHVQQPRILDDADDLDVEQLASESPADRLSILEILLGQRAIDDRDPLAALDVAVVEHPSGGEPRAERVEIARRDRVRQEHDLLVGARVIAFDAKAVLAAAAIGVNAARGERSRAHARKGSHAVEDALLQRDVLLGAQIAGLALRAARIERHGEHVRALDADVDGQEILEAADQQSGRRDEHERQGDLNHHEQRRGSGRRARDGAAAARFDGASRDRRA